MKLYIDTSRVTFSVSRDPEPKNDQNGNQRRLKDGTPMWQTQVYAQDEETGGEILMITVAGQKPNVSVGQRVTLAGLEAVPWNTNGKHGVMYRSQEMKPIAVSAGKAA